MAKHKKRRKRKAKNSGRSQPSDSPAVKSTKWPLKWPIIFCIIACAAIASFWSIKSFLRSDEQTHKEPPTILTEQSDPPTVPSKLTPEQEISSLMKEELELAEQMIRDFPGSEVPLVLMGNMYRNLGNSVEAVKYWEKALAQNPERPDVYNAMGWIAIEKGEYEQAITFWREALRIDPKMSAVHNSIAQALMALGKYREVVEEAEEELKNSPESYFSYYLLGQGYLKQNEYEKAKKYYEKAIELQPDHMNAYYGLFTVCSRLKLQVEAKEYMATFRKLKAEDSKALREGNKAFDDLVEIRKGVAEAYGDADKLYWEKRNLEKAEKLLQRAVTLDPNNTEYLMKLGSLFQGSNRLPEALGMYEKAREIEPDNMINYINIGVASMQLEQFTNAEKVFQKVITLAPKISDGYRELAHLYLITGTRLPEAMKLAKEAIALDEIAANYFILSWAYDKNGDVSNALSALKQAIELDPDNSKYRRMHELIQNRGSRDGS